MLTPFYAVAAVLLTLDLIAEKDGAGAATALGAGARMSTASIFSDFWNNLVDHDEQGLFLVFVGFILSFAFIRMSTRLMRSPRVPWWPGSVVSDSGVHIHHLVFGIVTMMVAGTLGFAALGHSPYAEICAFAFGVGAGLTIDEFALWVYLDDVYWADEGRSSIDATVIAAAAMMLILLGFTPFNFDTGSPEQARRAASSARSSSSPWSRSASPRSGCCTGRSASSSSRSRSTARRGSASRARPGRAAATASGGPKKQAKAEGRFPPDRRTERFKNAFRDIVGGKPSEGMAAAKEEALAATREATAEMRHRAERVTHPARPPDEDG